MKSTRRYGPEKHCSATRHMWPILLALAICSVEAQDTSLTILISNDDGFEAPGLKALYKELSSVAKVFVAAPVDDQSGTGHGITITDPILVRTLDKDRENWFAIRAKPATCVRLAIEQLLGERPDLVISGINRGENLGLNVFYSGTVAAAREAAILGVPAIAVSQAVRTESQYQIGARLTKEFVLRLKAQGLIKPPILLNINIPPLGTEEPLRTLVTRQSVRPTIALFERRTNPNGVVYFWPGYKTLRNDEVGTDVDAFNHGHVSITPLKLDQTNTPAMESLRKLEFGGSR